MWDEGMWDEEMWDEDMWDEKCGMRECEINSTALSQPSSHHSTLPPTVTDPIQFTHQRALRNGAIIGAGYP